MPDEPSWTRRPAAPGLMAQLDQVRIHRGLTRAGLAERAGLSVRTIIQAITTGKAQLYTVLAIADALRVELRTVTLPGVAPVGRPRHPHGTIAAVARHRRAKEDLCVRCLKADAHRKRLARAAKRMEAA